MKNPFKKLFLKEKEPIRHIKELLEEYPNNRLWVDVYELKTRKAFVKQLKELNGKFINGQPIKLDDCWYTMALSSKSLKGENDITRVSGMIYNIAMRNGLAKTFPKVIIIDLE